MSGAARPIGEIAEVVMGQSPPGASYNRVKLGEPLLNGPAEFNGAHPVAVQWTTEPTRFAQAGDILFCVRGATTGRKCWADQRYAIGRGLAAIRGRAGLCNTKYLWFVLDVVTEQLLTRAAGSTFVNLPGEELTSFKLRLPPLSEQERIAARLTEQLDAVERARAAAQARLAAAQALPAAHVREVFEGAEASGWETVRLLDLCEGSGQYGTSAKSNGRQLGLPVLGMPHIHGGRIRWEKVWHADLPPDEREKYRLVKGDLLFNRTNSAELVGKTAVFDGTRDAIFASYLIRFRVRPDKADSRFVSAFINSRLGRKYIERHMARAVGQVNISASVMAEMPVPCPPVERQREIIAADLSRRLAEAERLAERIREEVAAIDALPAALLREAFATEERE